MIIKRYLIREILITMLAVSLILLLVIMGSRFIRYFAAAAAGQLPVNLVGSLMLYHLPSFLQLILPLAFFLAVLLAYGQRYIDNEMTILQACGFSPLRLLSIALIPALLTAVIVALCSMWLTPAGLTKNHQLIQLYGNQADFSALSPGRFQSFGNNRMVYAQHIVAEGKRLQNVFISEQQHEQGKTQKAVVRAASGYQSDEGQDDQHYLVLSDGRRYVTNAGEHASQVLIFDKYAFLIKNNLKVDDAQDIDRVSTKTLLSQSSLINQAELQWRASLALMIVILAILSISLSKVNPRQGNFGKLLPAIILYVIYISLLLAAHEAMRSGWLPAIIGVWPIHLAFLILGLWLLKRTFGLGNSR